MSPALRKECSVEGCARRPILTVGKCPEHAKSDDIAPRAAEVAAGEWWSRCHDGTLAPSDLAALIRERDAEQRRAGAVNALRSVRSVDEVFRQAFADLHDDDCYRCNEGCCCTCWVSGCERPVMEAIRARDAEVAAAAKAKALAGFKWESPPSTRPDAGGRARLVGPWIWRALER